MIFRFRLNCTLSLFLSLFYLLTPGFAWSGNADAGAAKPPEGMAFIPAGESLLGFDPDQAYRQCLKNNDTCKKNWFLDEGPVHSAQLDGFFIDTHEVTQKEFARIMEKNPSEYTGADLPVENVTWHEAKDYCQRLGKRLPTEAEWERAAKGGKDSVFPWGDEVKSGKANFCDTHCDKRWKENHFDDGHRYTAPVGSFPPNEYGLYDTAGNVYEWVMDWYEEDYYTKKPRKNPRGPDNGKLKVIRGGSWINYSVGVRPSDRTDANPSKRLNFLGFRCAL